MEIKIKLIIPKIKLDGARIIQEGYCRDDASECRDIACKDCVFSEDNLKHFVQHFELEQIDGHINVVE